MKCFSVAASEQVCPIPAATPLSKSCVTGGANYHCRSLSAELCCYVFYSVSSLSPVDFSLFCYCNEGCPPRTESWWVRWRQLCTTTTTTSSTSNKR